MTASDVRALHHSYGKKHPICYHDAQPYPCETIRTLGPDPLDPPLQLPPETMADGTQVWPGDPRFAVRVRSVYGEAIEQIVEAFSLVDALEKAKAIPFEKWIRPEATEETGRIADAILPLVVEAQADAVEVAIDKLKSTPIVTLAGVGGAYEWLNDYAKALREGGGQ